MDKVNNFIDDFIEKNDKLFEKLSNSYKERIKRIEVNIKLKDKKINELEIENSYLKEKIINLEDHIQLLKEDLGSLGWRH